jgi:hypothetical protein
MRLLIRSDRDWYLFGMIDLNTGVFTPRGIVPSNGSLPGRAVLCMFPSAASNQFFQTSAYG